MGDRAAYALVFASSAAVLVVELSALRLLAPYLGLTLEMNTLVIGMVLAAIAVGAWFGGIMADQTDPRRMLGPLLLGSGLVIAATPAFVRWLGSVDEGLLMLGAMATLFVPGALLSAVSPAVAKLRLSTLEETGTVVGRVAGVGTAGAIFGTVLTGFVLVSIVRVSTILIALGVLLVMASVLLELSTRGWRGASGPTVLLLVVGLGAAFAPGGCDVETKYHCASVRVDEARDGGRELVLDRLRHSYVDLDDPTHLEFPYVRAIVSAIDASFPASSPLDAYHLGGGALTVPRYLQAVRPDTRSLVSEIDPGVVQISRDQLGLSTSGDLAVRVEDGRLGLKRLTTASRDLVVGDAFGGESVPWHLTTIEAMTDVRRVLADEGVYIANLIDHEPFGFARAEVATLQTVFANVVLVAEPRTFTQGGGGNLVVVASDAPIDAEAMRAALADRGVPWEVATGALLARWRSDARVLTDQFAPVDQLLTPR